MPALVLAFSVSDKIEQYGSYAGLAAILGIGVLALLYFAQAREVKRLREWAGRAPERASEIEQQAATAASRVRAQPPRPAAAAVTPAAARPVTPGQPAVPGQPAPATAAGQGQPAPAQPGSGPRPAGAPAQPAPAQPAPAAGGQPAAPGAAPSGTPSQPGAPSGTPPAGAPAGTPGGVPGAAPRPAAGAAARTAATGAGAAAGASRAAGPAGAPRPRRTVEVGGGGGGGTPPGRPPRDEEPKRRSRIAVVGAAVAALVVVVIVIVVVAGGGGGDGTAEKKPQTNTVAPQTRSTAGSEGGTSTTPRTPPKAETSVAVLNGTNVAGLARQVGEKVGSEGYPVDHVGDAADQAQQTSSVAYVDGYKASAAAIAKILGYASVVPIDQSTQVVAGDKAKVVVTVGLDTANKAQ